MPKTRNKAVRIAGGSLSKTNSKSRLICHTIEAPHSGVYRYCREYTRVVGNMIMFPSSINGSQAYPTP